MNTKSIQNTRVKSYPNFPPISSHKQNKTISKHFTNLSVYLPKKEYALLNWLVYESDKAGEFKYSTYLLRKFSAHIKAIELEYSGEIIPTAIQLIRADFKSLIENGYVLPIENSLYQLNPMLLKHSRGMAEEYQEIRRTEQ